MKRLLSGNLQLFFVLFIIFCSNKVFAQYNTLWIPDTLSGTTFNLTVKDTFAQLKAGNQTITGSVNHDNFWGPTLFLRKGDTVHGNVLNKLNDSTTIHWHGMHLPAIMDGGPHQIIPPGTLWQPYWKVTNQAAMLWYHPHLMDMTLQQLVAGVGGFIIIRDSLEATLALPRTYGVDDIPLALTSRTYDANNQFEIPDNNKVSQYGDYMLTNGTPNAQVSLPKQLVRLRILNGEVMRGYNLGFSDNRTFYIIGNDQGLLNAPVALKNIYLMPGERIEVLVDLGSDAVGSSIDMEAFNKNQPMGFPGVEPNKTGINGSLLNDTNFTVLHINVANTTAHPITVIPTKLANNVYWKASDATVQRLFNVTNASGTGLNQFIYDNVTYNFHTINQKVNQNAIEEWTIADNFFSSHTLHIHDVQFKIVWRNKCTNGFPDTVEAYEGGWKDNVFVPAGDTVSVIAKFSDLADSLHPFMYHCHMVNHEQGGMMGQFTVENNTSVNEVSNVNTDYTIFPNPAAEKLFISFADPNMQAYYIRITDMVGRTKYMLPSPQLNNGIDVSTLALGVYLLQLTDNRTKAVITKKFIKE